MSCLLLIFSARLFAVGWTPTDGGLVLNLEQGDRFLLSVVANGKEYFVYNYNRYTGGDFNYTAGLYLKLIPQASDATEPSEMSIWQVGAPLARESSGKKLLPLGGIAYTIWNDGKTLRTNNTNYQFMGDLTADYSYKDACDVVFIVPTDQASRTSFDPNRTLYKDRGRTDQASDGKINGRIGTGFLGMTYREVYMLDIPRMNPPMSYTNASLVTFNTTNKQKSWSNGQIKCDPGHAAYAFADSKHQPTTRTLFRLYMLDKPINSCSSYFFATDEQDYLRYRNAENPKTSADSTAAKKIYTWDHLVCMERDGSTEFYKSDYMFIPEPDSTYYYVGYNNDYKAEETGETMGSAGAHSRFEKIRDLPMKDLAGFKAPAGAFGRMVVNTTSSEYNLGVGFEPAGYFLKVSTGTNVRMRQTGPNEWTTQDMWTITEEWAALSIQAMLMTGPTFREDDPGAAVEGWSVEVQGTAVPVSDGTPITEGSGYARITTNSTAANGNMVFVKANNTRHLTYNNNDFLGEVIPDQYPLGTDTIVTVQAPRIKAGYEFDGWTKNAMPSVGEKRYQAGDTIRLSAGTTTLYVQAHYNGTLQVAISFVDSTDGTRYFLTHPNTSTPRYARARHFEDWENTWQGMENAENLDPNYVSTYEVRCPINEIHKKDGDIPDLKLQEHVLDPRQYTMHGYEDSLVFYENFAPARDEYLGLYYSDPNTIVANNTWAGLFTTTSTATSISWPTYQTPYISGVKLKSERYVEEYDHEHKPDSLILKVRSNRSAPYVKYDRATDQFDGQADSASATTFDISAVSVADAHYIIVPDTSHAWQDTITFAFHQDEPIREEVWSSLIGKQLMAVMRLGDDTVYFHPNRDKVINDPNNLYLSQDFRVSQVLELIRDSRVSAPLSAGDSVQHETTDYHWHNDIVSGNTSPIDVKDGSGNYIDIIDTFRITVSHGGISKIKEYRGLWHKDAPGLHMNPDGSRYRDVIIKTKTYHYGAEQTRLVLTPEKESYNFGPLAGQTQQINFMLTREHYRQMVDIDGNEEGEYILSVDTLTSGWQMLSGGCDFNAEGKLSYAVSEAVGSRVTIRVTKENTSGVNNDTLIISKIQFDSKDSTINVRIPLVQAPLEGTELLWSVVYNKQRYFITAGSGGLIARKYNLQDKTLYKENTKTHLIKGMKNDANSDNQYITTWQFAYSPDPSKSSDTLTLYTHLLSGTNKHFCITGEGSGRRGAVGESASLLIYRYANVYVNENANYEEEVRLRYGPDGWLKLTGITAGVPTIELTTDSANATVFSWGYLQTEYSLLNNGTYPSQDEAVFEYNSTSPVDIQTRYKAYREYTMLLNNSLTYLCRKEETRMDSLISASREWLTSYTVDTIRDHRTALSGLNNTFNATSMTTTVTPTGESPIGLTNIVDTLRVTLSLQKDAPAYRFKGDWSGYTSISDANLKIPLVRKAYHTALYDSLVCVVDNDDAHYVFPADGEGETWTYDLYTLRRKGTKVMDATNTVVAVKDVTTVDSTSGMDLTNKNMSEIRLMDIYGNKPNWCEISDTTAHTITIRCKEDGIRSPREAYLYLAYIIMVDHDDNPATPKVMRFVNYRLTVSQVSNFNYANNQVLIHSHGASGDEKMANGMQQVHENKRILYYYPDQDVELPVRERAFYGWWRWYREGKDVDGMDVSDTDIPDTLWRKKPINTGKYNFPYRVIGDSVPIDPEEPEGAKKLVTMGRWTVFHYKSKDYGNKKDPPAKNPRVAPPDTMRAGVNRGKPSILTYAVDISNYYDNLPMSVKNKNQVDVDMLDTILEIHEPTLSLREVFELHPWREIADTLDHYKSEIPEEGEKPEDKVYPLANEKYMEDHVMMAPIGNRLLLSTEQRYNLKNLQDAGYSESLLGYYMHDDNWASMSDVKDEDGWSRKDSMIWCGGWDAECVWYTYDQSTQKYTLCTHPITDENDFLRVPAKGSISTGHEFDTVYYCLRARSKASPVNSPDPAEPADGEYFFNICRYKLIYHNPNKYGPLKETKVNGVTKAIIPNEEIEERYDVLERLNFDYVKPGSGYHVYPHPLPWADASYGYTYPETSDLPHNRYHDESDFPNHGEYGLINRIPYSTYWHKMEQHGGAANGYMIYCDGMASSGQVAALTLETHLCAGQKMFFSGYVGNPSSQTGKADPNFTFSVQGAKDSTELVWEDITSYMTGDIAPSNQWYQIYFPIVHNEGGKEYSHFRVRIYNSAANFDGNDFIIDDMCIFATKPPLIAYQANTTCRNFGEDEADTHVILRIDYQGITSDEYNGDTVRYTVRQKTLEGVYSYIPMTDGYLNDSTAVGRYGQQDTIFGKIYVPARNYEPQDEDSIYRNMNQLIHRFDTTDGASKVREGYIYEILEGDIRPVKYIVHSARLNPSYDYTVHMSTDYRELLSSICGMTSQLKVSNRMVLNLNGVDQPEVEQIGLCANSTYDISMRVKGPVYRDSVAPIIVTGSCVNDWLMYGDTARESSKKRYGYYYKDIVKVVTDILRYAPMSDLESNSNQFAPNLASVDTAELNRVYREHSGVKLPDGVDPYELLAHLVDSGFLLMYKPKLTASVFTGDSLQFVILPIVGSGTEEVSEANVEVCPNPIFIKLKPDSAGGIPLMVGGLKRDSTEKALPVNVLASAQNANTQIKLRVDSIMPRVGIYSVELRSTDDPDYREGVHHLELIPNLNYPIEDYYVKGDSIILRPSPSNNYTMKAGYNYTFNIVMQTWSGSLHVDPANPNSCEVGTVPFTLSIVPDYLRWNPQSSSSNNWNDADNWLGINEKDEPIHADAHFVPMENTYVLIKAPGEGKPYPVVQPMPTVYADSIQKVGFQYNQCNAIRFMPGAAIGQQQRMNYNDVVVDMQLPQQKWAFRTAPVKGMVSGDLFIADADDDGTTPLWEVGEFDASGRSYKTGNASFWLSMYNTDTKQVNHTGEDSTRTGSAEWSRVTNAMNMPLPEGQGFAVYTRVKSGVEPIVRLPKNDDTYYYYGTYGERIDDKYVTGIRDLRNKVAGSGITGDLSYHPEGDYETITLANAAESPSFVFGNPTMGYIDIWGFIADNRGVGTANLVQEIGLLNEMGSASLYTQVTKETAEALDNKLSEFKRYLPPMQAIVLNAPAATDTLRLRLYTNRVVTNVSQVVSAPAPRRASMSGRRPGIMTVTAKNPASARCTSHLLLGQGYHNAIVSGEDAILTTINIDNYTANLTPTTPFNLYAVEQGNGMSINLRDSIVNVPISFYMSDLEFEPVTQLWFTGVNNIDGQLVLYDAWTDTERKIVDGICLKIQTPEQNHERRYYIRRLGYSPEEISTPIATGMDFIGTEGEQAIKFMKDGLVYIWRNGHIYTIFGQKVR